MKTHRAYNQSYVENNSFIKLSQEDRLFDEISYYKTIKNYPQKKMFAEYIKDKSNGLTYALELKNYINYINYGDYCLNNNNSDSKIELLHIILNNLKSFHVHVESDIPLKYNMDNKQLNYKMLIEKTYREFLNLKNDNAFESLCSKPELLINSKSYKNFELIWDEIKEIILNNYSDFNMTLIHGDLCFSNILVNNVNEPIYFVDPRGSYGLKGCFGDKDYDYAKLLHSIEGNYEQIIYDLFDFNILNETIQYNLKYLSDAFRYNIDKNTLVKSKLIEGLIFIGMCARHNDSKDRQIVMYSTGITILNNWLNNYR